MNEYKKSAGLNSEVVSEYRLLNALVRNKNYIDDSRVTADIFINETAKSLYESIILLYSQNIEITPASLYQAGYNIDYNVSNQIVQEVFNIDEKGASSLDDIIASLKNIQNKNIIVDKLNLLANRVSNPGTLDIDNTLGKLYELDEIVAKSGKSNSKLLSYDEWANRYIDDLEQRKLGRKYSFGDPLLDKYLFKGAAPGNITVVTAATNMGKSTYVLSLIDNLIDNNTPCMYISLEMGTIDTFDRLIAKRLGIENQELYKPENMEGIIEQVKEEKENMSTRKNFYFCEATGVDINKLKSLIREFKQKTKKDYCLIAIDLLSGMKGFMNANNGSSTANTIEVNMNRLEELAKEENVHILGVVQLNRQSDNSKINHVEQINALRPSLGDVKNSAAYAEKATTLLSLFRPKYYADRYCKSDPASETMEDILEVQVLKDRNAQSGKIFKYIFDGKFFKLLPLMDDEVDKLEKLKELDIDY